MLGLYITARIVVVVMDYKGEKDRKKQSIEEGRSFWVDRYGSTHHIENDEPYMHVTDYKTGDLVEINPYTGEYKKNLTREARQRQKKERAEEAKEHGRRIYPVGSVLDDRGNKPKYCEDGKYDIAGRRWIDRSTNKTYVRRKFGISTFWYLDINTGLYAFPDDSCYGNNNAGYLSGKFCYFIYTEDTVKETLTFLNSEQQKAIDKYGFKSDLSSYAVWHNDMKG